MKKDERPFKIRQTIINWELKESYRITALSYIMADIIRQVSKNDPTGWCSMSRLHLGRFGGITGRVVYKCMGELVEKGLIEKIESTNYHEGRVRTTEEWNRHFDQAIKEESAPIIEQESEQFIKEVIKAESIIVEEKPKEKPEGSQAEWFNEINYCRTKFALPTLSYKELQGYEWKIIGELKKKLIDKNQIPQFFILFSKLGYMTNPNFFKTIQLRMDEVINMLREQKKFADYLEKTAIKDGFLQDGNK